MKFWLQKEQDKKMDIDVSILEDELSRRIRTLSPVYHWRSRSLYDMISHIGRYGTNDCKDVIPVGTIDYVQIFLWLVHGSERIYRRRRIRRVRHIHFGASVAVRRMRRTQTAVSRVFEEAHVQHAVVRICVRHIGNDNGDHDVAGSRRRARADAAVAACAARVAHTGGGTSHRIRASSADAVE